MMSEQTVADELRLRYDTKIAGLASVGSGRLCCQPAAGFRTTRIFSRIPLWVWLVPFWNVSL